MKCQESVKNAHPSFPDHSVHLNSLKHKNSSFIIINDTEKQHILIFKRQNQQFCSFLLKKKTKTINGLSK